MIFDKNGTIISISKNIEAIMNKNQSSLLSLVSIVNQTNLAVSSIINQTKELNNKLINKTNKIKNKNSAEGCNYYNSETLNEQLTQVQEELEKLEMPEGISYYCNNRFDDVIDKYTNKNIETEMPETTEQKVSETTKATEGYCLNYSSPDLGLCYSYDPKTENCEKYMGNSNKIINCQQYKTSDNNYKNTTCNVYNSADGVVDIAINMGTENEIWQGLNSNSASNISCNYYSPKNNNYSACVGGFTNNDLTGCELKYKDCENTISDCIIYTTGKTSNNKKMCSKYSSDATDYNLENCLSYNSENENCLSFSLKYDKETDTTKNIYCDGAYISEMKKASCNNYSLSDSKGITCKDYLSDLSCNLYNNSGNSGFCFSYSDKAVEDCSKYGVGDFVECNGCYKTNFSSIDQNGNQFNETIDEEGIRTTITINKNTGEATTTTKTQEEEEKEGSFNLKYKDEEFNNCGSNWNKTCNGGGCWDSRGEYTNDNEYISCSENYDLSSSEK